MEKAKTKKHVVKRVIDVVSTVVLIIVAIMVALSIYSKKSNKNVLPYNVMWVLTPSMEDTIPEQSYVLTKKIDAKNVKEEDIITFRFDQNGDGVKNELNTHRVKNIIGDNEKFITKGDNNAICDPEPVLAEDVVAVYVRNLPVLTAFGRFYTTTYGFALTMIVLAAFLLLSSYFNKKKDDAEEENADKQSEIDRLVAKEIEKLEKEGYKVPSETEKEDKN